MSIRKGLLAVAVVPLVFAFASPASAGFFGSIGKAVGGAAKSVSHTASKATNTVGKAAGNVAKGVGKTATKAVDTVGKGASSVAKDVSHATSNTASSVGKAVGGAAKDVGHAVSATAPKLASTYMKVAKPVGTVISKGYGAAGDVISHVPSLKEAAPLAKDISKAAVSKEGKIGTAVGAGAALLTGGVSQVAIGARQGAMTAYYGKQAYDGGRKSVNEVQKRVKKDLSEINRSARRGS